MAAQTPDPLLNRIKALGPPTTASVLWGYLGEEVDDGVVDPGQTPAKRVQKLYQDLTQLRWMEINVDDILESEPLSSAGGSLVWVTSGAPVATISIAQASSLDVALAFLGGSFISRADLPDDDGPPDPPRTTGAYWCH